MKLFHKPLQWYNDGSSPPTRGRGLKHVRQRLAAAVTQSPPTRGRGLKRYDDPQTLVLRLVAPHAGAWIETMPGAG